MSAPSRTAVLTKIHKTLRKHYKPVAPNLKMPLLEQLLFACCLEDSTPTAAEKAYASLDEQYFDWNEVRVSTVTELGETFSMLPEPAAAASRIKRILQGVFEATYSFDLEALKKQNIGAAVKRLSKYDGVTPFAAAYVTQTSLGGHSIPLARGSLEVLYVLGLASEKEKTTGGVSGLERAIPKNKGIEFGSLLHQLGVDFQRSPFAAALRKLLLSIVPDAKDRFPKRGAKPPSEVPPPGSSAGDGATDAKQLASKKKEAAPPPKAPEPPKGHAPKKPSPAEKKLPDKKSAAEAKAAAAKKAAAARKPPAGRTPPRKPR